MKKVLCLVMLVTLVGWAAGTTFTNDGGDGRWDNPLNWSNGLPGGTEGAEIANGNTALIDSVTTAAAYGLNMGLYGAVSGVDMTGGSLTVGNWGLNIGRGGNGNSGHTGSFGTFQMSGGVLNTPWINMPEMWGASPVITGHWIMDGGTANAGWMKLGGDSGAGVGTLDFNGGTINLTDWLTINGVDSSMDIAGGTLIIDGDHTSTIQGYIDNGWITAYDGTGDFELDYNITNSSKTTLSAVDYSMASGPNPGDGATGIGSSILSWTPGASATSHDVYFGAVDPPPFAVNQPIAQNSYDAGRLSPNTTYYWRIDAKDGGTVWTGDVWEFTTGNLPDAAVNFSPANGSVDQMSFKIRWIAGAGAESHDVYFGTTNPPAFVGNQVLGETTYESGSIQANTTYYWRIDERNVFGTTAGTVWSFTTGRIFGDINGDWVLDILDFREFANDWLDNSCTTPGWCDGSDLSQDSEVDYEDYALLAGAMAPAPEVVPPYTDYNAMLSQEIQGKKHGFMAGNVTYYIGGRYGWDDPAPAWYENETIGLTHPFHHDLRSRGHGMVSDPDTEYGHDLQGWEFWKDTKVAYGSVWIGGTKYTNPVPTAMYWQPDKMICEYSVGGVTIQEEKFIADNDAACTIITSSAPITLEFEGQSFANNKTITTTATCQLDTANNAVHIVEGGTVEVKPTTSRVATGVMMYDGMSTVISASKPITNYTQSQVSTFVSGQWTYSFKVPCDSSGVSIAWSMDDVYSTALGNVQEVIADPAGKMQAKSDEMNDILNYQIPYFRCSDQDIVDIYYYLWSLQMMYMIDVGEGWEQYPHTQSAVNNFLGMHRYDAVFQSRVGSWAADKDRFANGNVLIWSALLPYSQGCGEVGDNMGQGWHSGIYGPEVIAHVPQAWQIYQHSGDLAFLNDAYAFYKPLFWGGVCEHWGYMFEGAECLGKMATELGYPEDVQHWHDMVNLDNVDNWINARWDASQNMFLPSDPQGWTSMAYMGMPYFHRDKAIAMTENWAVDNVDGFYSSVPLTVRALKDWHTIIGLDNDFVVTPDTNWYAIRGMYMHHVGNNANVCALGHLKNYNYSAQWDMPIAPEAFDRDPDTDALGPWGDQYSNFNAGKILFILEGMSGINYSVVDDKFEVADHMPLEWDFMEFMIPINQGGETSWTRVRTDRAQVGPNIEKTITVEGNTQSTLNIQPWLDDKTLHSAPAGYVDQQPDGHIGYEFQDTESETLIIYVQE